jgi:hypothetical protein
LAIDIHSHRAERASHLRRFISVRPDFGRGHF